ncbi:MAG: DUF2239 family protein, partial [Candidatus Protistobacter heckmanni]|nr:DUF2239 family protein [Candidatus Protistobacter heckmanni]
AVKQALESNAAGPVLTFDDRTGRVVDIDTRGTAPEMLARLKLAAAAQAEAASAPAAPAARGRGRPKLGVVAREVTLLQRHWDWLAAQPGGASVALRKLVEEARLRNGDRDSRRQAQERTYQFLSAMAGDMAGFEEASRALFADDAQGFAKFADAWPADVRGYALRLLRTPE